MKIRKCDRVLPDAKEPVRYCECGAPIYDGRRKKCPACRAAMKKVNSKRPSAIAKYETREQLLVAITELEQSMRMQQWMLDETKKKVNMLSELVFKI